MAESNKRAADQAADEQHLQKRAKTSEYRVADCDDTLTEIQHLSLSLMTPSQEPSTHSISQTPSRSSKHRHNQPISLKRHSLLEWTGGSSPIVT